jgi:Tfp pilus assembly protein PilZ
MSVSSGGPPGGEKRRGARFAIPAAGAPVSVIGARLLDLSGYGMMIESPFPMELDSVLPFRLVVIGEKVDVEARVATCTPRAGDRRRVFGVGLEFVALSQTLRDRLVEAARATEAAAAPVGSGRGSRGG